MSDIASRFPHLSPLKQALLALQEMKARLDEAEGMRTGPIAVVGIGCRFPGDANSPDEFWQLLREGRDAVVETPEDRWNLAEFYSANPDDPGRMATRHGGFLRRVDLFDAEFFGISPREAENIDPQQRLALEAAWEAIEDAGYAPGGLSGSRTGVFLGITGDEYAQRFWKARDLSRFDIYFASGIARSIAAGRISYVLGLNGPTLVVDTACSSSLVAVHQACQSLRLGECRMALAGGVNVVLSAETTLAFSKARMMAPDGRCKTFDAAADGFVRGEGCGILVLKRLSDAIADGDPIRAVISASAINQDGRSSGLTAPSGPAQQGLLRKVLADAGMEGGEVQYVEAHGTGTALGDPIEVQALAAVLGKGRGAKQPLLIGSVKTNLGHLESAAGVAGLIKTILAMEHGEIPPHLHFHTLNPHIELDGAWVEVPTSLRPWPEGKKRVAGVSSFGFSGTNAHVIVESAPMEKAAERTVERPLHLFTLSGRSPEAVASLAGRYVKHLERHPELEIGDICFTANAGRTQWQHRFACTIESAEELKERLGAEIHPVESGRERRGIVFLFPGQGAQYAGMGRELYETQPVFREALRKVLELAAGKTEHGLEEVLFGGDGELLGQTGYTQPALFAVEYALAELWRSWGIEPDYVLGHSVGEYVAACVAGVFSLEQAVELIVARGRLMQSLPEGGAPGGGAMAALRMSEEQAIAAVAGCRGVWVAAVNGPESVVVSGEAAAVEELRAGFGGQRLAVSHAFHSGLMEPILDEFRRVAERVEYGEPKIGLIGNRRGRKAEPGEVTKAEYWVRQLREPVRFGRGIEAAWEAGARVMVEVGPGTTLLGLGRRNVEDGGEKGQWLASLRGGRGEWRQMVESVGKLYEGGVEVDWEAFDKPYQRRRVALPTYPFERQRYWAELPSGPGMAADRNISANPDEWKTALSISESPWLADHQVRGQAILPFAAYLGIVLRAMRETGRGTAPLVDVEVERPLEIPAGAEQALVVRFKGEAWELLASRDGLEQRYAGGRLRAVEVRRANRLETLRKRATEPVVVEEYYARLRDLGVDFGPSFRTLQELWKGEGKAVGRVGFDRLPAGSKTGAAIHPVLLDGCLQVIGAALDDERLYLPVGVEEYAVHIEAPKELWSCAEIRERGEDDAVVDLWLFDRDGVAAAAIRGLRLRAARENWLHEMQWRRKPRATAGGWSPRKIAAAIEPRVAPLHAAEGADRFTELRPQLDRLCLGYMAKALRQLGWSYIPGERLTAETVASRLGIVQRQARLFRRLLDILAEDGVLRKKGSVYEVVATLPLIEVEDLAGLLAREYPGFAAELELTVRCGPSLSDVLSDLCDPLTLLFPDRSAANLAALYRSSPQARVFNTLLGEGIRQGLAERRGNAPLRVLEIGGGTGGSTPYVLEALPDNTAEYLFTDISPRFTLRAEELFGDYSFFRTEVLDIERDPDTQGFALHSFDLIVAANVLHATADLRETLAHVRQLLAPAGLLAMVETTEPDRWIDLSFGLLDGWWRFRDFDLRPNHTLLTGPRWVSLLGEIGFGDAVAVGTPVENLLFARASEATPEGRWLVLGDCEGTGQRLADELRAGGADCVLADAATSLKTAGFDRVVDLRALDASVAEDVLVDATAMTAATTMTAVSLVNQLASQPDKPPRLWLVTRGAQAVESNRAIALWQTPLWGLGRAIALEQPDLRCARIDLDPEGGLDGLVEELVHPDEEDQIAWRGGVRYVTRLVRSREATPGDEQTRLEQIKPGELDGLEFRSASRAMPAAREVEIRVLFSALNFKDVLRALGHFPENTVPLGSECAGIVERVGEGVTEFAPGDRVMAVAAGAFGNFVTVASCFTAHCPSNLSLAAAATLPIAFLTARYALDCIGGMKAGDRVLIHAAAGGVGLAALQLARRTGAEIFATAGSEAKRQWVRSLGAAHVFSSREQGFAEEIARLTGGRGVDLVLNSLAGEFVTAGLKTVVPGGLFLEIGKAGVLELERVRALRPDIRYEVLDWGELAESDPAEVERMLRTIAVEAQTGEIKPLPFEVYEREEIESAFRTMAQGRHRGKLIVRQAARRNEITASGAYLITGGLGGLGLCVAEWLAVHGARHLVLVGRSEPGAEAKAVIDRLHSSGAVVWVRRADVRQREEIASVIAELDATGVQLAGIVHSAGVLDDGLLAQQNEARMERVLGPKVGGAWHLDELSRGRDLGMFVLFSSLASVVGSAGQANHAAANAFLDGLARWRRARGEVAVSIQWGAWSEMGSATGAELRRRRETKGIGEMRPAQGLALFEEILRRDRVEVAAGPVDWARFAREGAGGRAPWLAELVAAGERGRADRNAARTDTADLMRRVEEAPEGQRKEFLTAHVRAEAARILGMDSQRVDSRRPLSELGLDSLMSVELRNALSAAAGTPLPATLLYNYPSVQDIALHLYELLFASASDGTGEVSQDAEGANLLGSIENMSDDDVERLLAQEMGEAR